MIVKSRELFSLIAITSVVGLFGWAWGALAEAQAINRNSVRIRSSSPCAVEPPRSSAPASSRSSWAVDPEAGLPRFEPFVVITRRAPDVFRLDRAALRMVLRLDGEAKSAFAPALDGRGHPRGVRITLAENSAFRQLGLRSDDVIERINGIALTAPDRMPTIYRAISVADRIDVELRRDDRPIHLRFDVE